MVEILKSATEALLRRYRGMGPLLRMGVNCEHFMPQLEQLVGNNTLL